MTGLESFLFLLFTIGGICLGIAIFIGWQIFKGD